MLMQHDSDEGGSVQERYHNYILRKLKEERRINTASDSAKE